MKNIVILPLVFLLTLFLDGQIAMFIDRLLLGDFRMASYMVFLLLILLAFYLSDDHLITIVSIIGGIYDIIQLNLLGVAVFAFPILFMLFSKLFSVISLTITTALLSMVVVIFTFESLLYGLSHLLQLTSYSFVYFIVNLLAPTLLLNILLTLLLYPIMSWIFQKNRHLIVTNV